jgi:FkbM family methyltransferase
MRKNMFIAMNWENYRQLRIADLLKIALARAAQWIILHFESWARGGKDLDYFIRMANLHQCRLARHKDRLRIASPDTVMGVAHQFEVRLGTSDLVVYSSGVFGQDYRPLFDLIGEELSSIRFVVDAGANVGTAAFLFYTTFPQASIYSIEADHSNHSALVANMQINNCQRVTPRHAALWGRAQQLTVSKSQMHWGRKVSDTEPDTRDANPVSAITLSEILIESPHGQIDVLKMDIEGAEESIFDESVGDGLAWLKKVRYLAIEIHGPILEKRIKRLLKEHSFSLFQTGETTYAKNLDFKQ